MRYWKKVLSKGLTHKEVMKIMKSKKDLCFATRPEWKGFHYIGKDGKYRILFKDGHYEMIDPCEAWDIKKKDWMIVTIKPEAFRILQSAPNGGVR